MNGTIVRLKEEKGFGFIRIVGEDYFFHRSCFNGHWKDLIKDFENGDIIEVTFDVVKSNRGPRAENVRRTDYPNQAV